MITQYSPGLFLHFFMAFVITLGPALALFVIACTSSLSLRTVMSVSVIFFGLVFAGSYFMFEKNEVEVSDTGLRVQAARFYQQEANLSEIESIKTLSYQDFRASEFSPTLRTNGIGFGSYLAGDFKLKNGAPALLLINSRHQPVTIVKVDRKYLVFSGEVSLPSHKMKKGL